MPADRDTPINRALAPWGLSGAVVEGGPQDHHGLSGVRVWRVRSGEERFALRQLGGSLKAAKRASETHRLMRYAARALKFVPWPRSAKDGETIALHEGSYWSLESWMPGEPADTPTREQIEFAASALWRFHEVTHDSQCFGPFDEEGPSKAVRRRREVLEKWSSSGGELSIKSDPEVQQQVDRLQQQLPAAVRRALPLIERVVDGLSRQQPILGDVRRDHVLFSSGGPSRGGRVTGLVDYGAATLDSPMVDLARLLGELAGDDADLWTSGLTAYQTHRRLTDHQRSLIVALDAGGVVGASINWLGWLATGTVAPSPPVALRLGELADRLGHISGGNLVAERASTGGTA